MYGQQSHRGSASKGFTIFFIVLYMLSQGFYAFSSINELESRTAFNWAAHFWSYLAVTGVVWIFLVISFIIWLKSMEKYGSVDQKEGLFAYARTIYPRFTVEAYSFFVGTLVMWVLTWVPWAVVIADVGMNFKPDYTLGPINMDNLEVYFVHYYLCLFSLASFILSINFLWVFAGLEKMFVLEDSERVNDYIKNSQNMSVAPAVALQRGQTSPSPFYPGAAKNGWRD